MPISIYSEKDLVEHLIDEIKDFNSVLENELNEQLEKSDKE